MLVVRLPSRWPLAAFLLAILPGMTEAQARPGQAPAQAPWPAVQAGLRVGYDDTANGNVVGAQIRVPVLRNGWVEIAPSGDITFLTGLREYQFNGDAVLIPGGGAGGIYVAGGVVARNSIFDGPDRETRLGGSVAGGFMSRGSGDVPIGVQIELRWIFIDAPFSPRTVTFGVNLPLWGWGRGGGR